VPKRAVARRRCPVRAADDGWESRRHRLVAAGLARWALACALTLGPWLSGVPPPAHAASYTVWAPVLYKASVGWNAGLQVQNLGPAPASIRVPYSRPDGGVALTEVSGAVAPGAALTFYLPGTELPAGFAGSASVTANQPIAAIVNLINYELAGGLAARSSYNPVDVPHRRVNLPFISRNEFFSTSITVLNTTGAAATLDVAMYDLKGDRVGGWPRLALPAFSSRTLDVARPASDRIGGANFSGAA